MKEFTSSDTKKIKGIAIILMLIHHLWTFPERLVGGELNHLFNIFGDSSIFIIGSFGQICVSIFFFLGGYGIYMQSKKRNFNILNNLKKLYIAYWKVFIIFIPITPLFFIIEALKDKFVLILFLLAAIDFITDDKIGAFIILGITLISVIIRFSQDYSTYKFNEKLKEQIRIFTDVIREGKQKEIRQEKVIYGDIITLSAGSVIPADFYLFESKDLFINQSAFTGESAAVEKNINMESESTSMNVKLGYKAKMKRGEPCGTISCYGYIWDKKEKELSPTTVSTGKQELRNYVFPEIAYMSLKKIDALVIQKIINKLRDRYKERKNDKGEQVKLSMSTVNNVYRLLRKILNKAVAWGFIDSNPVLKVKAPGNSKVEKNLLIEKN